MSFLTILTLLSKFDTYYLKQGTPVAGELGPYMTKILKLSVMLTFSSKTRSS
jgi:hypothetical protein